MRELLVLAGLAGVLHAARSFVPEGGEPPEVASVALSTGFLLLTAFVVGRIFALVRLPRIVAYLITGMVLGPSLLGVVPVAMLERLDLVKGVAICLIAFTAGGELKLRQMRPLLRTIGSLTGVAVLGTGVLLTAALILMRPWLPFLGSFAPLPLVAFSAMVAVALVAQSPAVVMALLDETRSEGPLSRTSLGAVVLADLAVVVLFGVLSALAQATAGRETTPALTAMGIAWELFGSFGVGVGLGVLIALYLGTVREGTALFVLLLCVVAAEVGIQLALDPLLIMLAAGLYVENVARTDAEPLITDIQAGSLPVYVLFFAVAGAGMHLGALAEMWPAAVALVALRAVGFWAGSAVATRGADPMVRRWAWAGLLPQAGLALALALIVERAFGAVGQAASALILSVIAINETIMPVVFRQALAAAGEVGARTEPAEDTGAGASTSAAS